MRPVATPVTFSDDVLLRERGFVISDRPTGQEAVWLRDGTHYPQTMAVRKARQERKEQLEALESEFSR